MEMKARMNGQFSDQTSPPHPPFKPFMWGRHWPLPQHRERPPEELSPRLKERKFLGRQRLWCCNRRPSFSRRYFAVHADADYILNFKDEIGVQRQI